MEGSKCFIAGFISRDQLHTVNVVEHGIQIAGAYQLSFVQETDTVADILHLLLVVAGKHRNQSTVNGFLTEHALELVTHDGIKTVKGFVT